MNIDLDKPMMHRNITLRKALYFSLASGVGAVIMLAVTFILTEIVGLWYIWSMVFAGGLAMMVKYVINALWTFRD